MIHMRPLFLNPVFIGNELIYSFLIIVLCLMIYYATKEIYTLSNHKGIKFFRMTFFLLGLAYLFRFIVQIVQMLIFNSDIFIRQRIFNWSLLLITSYLSTAAILYLYYSVSWKKIPLKHFEIWSTILALIISIVVFFTHSHDLLISIQALILISGFIIGFWNKKNNKKHSKMFVLYILIMLFWLFNLVSISPRQLLPFEVHAVLNLFSIIAFLIIYLRVRKWVQ